MISDFVVSSKDQSFAFASENIDPGDDKQRSPYLNRTSFGCLYFPPINKRDGESCICRIWRTRTVCFDLKRSFLQTFLLVGR